MTAQEYLEEFQRKYQKFDYLVEILLDRRDIMLGRELLDTNDKVPRFALEIASHTFDYLFTELPDETRAELESELAGYLSGKSPEAGWAQRVHNEFLNEFLNRASDDTKGIFTHLDLAVGELETASFNAFVVSVPGQESTWVIALHQGLSGLVYEVARIVSSTYKVSAGDTTVEMVEPLTSQEAASSLYERLNCYLHLGVAYGNEYRVSQPQIHMASSVTRMAERFAYLHEMSHVILGHLNDAPLFALPGDWSAARHTTHESDQEYEADILAWNLLVTMFVGNLAELQMAYAGAMLLLSVSHILECASDSGSGGTHPPALRRKAYIYEAVKHNLNEIGVSFEQASMIERAMSEGLDKVMAEVHSLPGSCPFEAVLERASSTAIPNHMLFQSELMPLLRHSAPSKLCRAMGYALGSAEIELRKLGWLDGLQDENAAKIELRKLGWLDDLQDEKAGLDKLAIDAARKPFNKFKLIRGLMELYLIPEISRFIERYYREYVGEALCLKKL